MKTDAFSVSITENGTEAIAVFHEEAISYSNAAFEKFYNMLTEKEKDGFRSVVSRLNAELLQSGKSAFQKQIQLPPNDEKANIDVYLLNSPVSNEPRLLLVVSRTEPFGTLPYFNPGRTEGFDNSPKVKLSPAFSRLIGEDIHFKGVLFKAQKAAQSDYPIMISGESGTGKEILAKTIHKASRRRDKRFVDINCAAIPDQLIDSELFGYEKGAFTGALPGGRHGLFVEANEGTLFLDEIADASLQTQAKLLRVLNEGSFKRVGSTKNIKVDVRIISATNRDLSQMVETEKFRQDLIYRLNTIGINLPPLRQRPGDIPLLSEYFLERHAKKEGRFLKFTANCHEYLQAYHWPGNVRELKGVIDYMVTMATGSQITRDHLPDFLLSSLEVRFADAGPKGSDVANDNSTGLLSQTVQCAEKRIIRDVLLGAKNRSEAIKILGTSRRTFYAKLKQYNLE